MKVSDAASHGEPPVDVGLAEAVPRHKAAKLLDPGHRNKPEPSPNVEPTVLKLLSCRTSFQSHSAGAESKRSFLIKLGQSVTFGSGLHKSKKKGLTPDWMISSVLLLCKRKPKTVRRSVPEQGTDSLPATVQHSTESIYNQ